MITKPTRVTDFSATLIDHIYTNKKNLNCKSGILVTDVSDHFGIFSILKNVNNINTTKSNTKRSRSFNDENMKIFKKLLDTTDFQEILNTECPDKAYNEFIDIYMDAFEIAVPLKDLNTPKNLESNLLG